MASDPAEFDKGRWEMLKQRASALNVTIEKNEEENKQWRAEHERKKQLVLEQEKRFSFFFLSSFECISRITCDQQEFRL